MQTWQKYNLPRLREKGQGAIWRAVPLRWSCGRRGTPEKLTYLPRPRLSVRDDACGRQTSASPAWIASLRSRVSQLGAEWKHLSSSGDWRWGRKRFCKSVHCAVRISRQRPRESPAAVQGERGHAGTATRLAPGQVWRGSGVRLLHEPGLAADTALQEPLGLPAPAAGPCARGWLWDQAGGGAARCSG